MDNTAKDAAKAKAAGLSYGYWKIANPNTKPVEEEKTNRVCPECGKAFYAIRSDRVYCSDYCRKRKDTRAYKNKKAGVKANAVPAV